MSFRHSEPGKWPCGMPRTPANTVSVGQSGYRCAHCRKIINDRHLKKVRERSGATDIVIETRREAPAPKPAKSDAIPSARRDCLHNSSCRAKTPGKHCKPCSLTARNKVESSARMKALWERPGFGEARGASLVSTWTAEKRAARAAQVSAHRLAWCPPEHRALYRELREKKIPAETAREAVLAEIARARLAIEAFDRRQRERHEREKAQAY